MPFTLIGRYQWVREIGAGGFGAVEQYRDLLTGENVAIKTIPAVFVNQESKRLVRELDIMRFLHDAHPHVISFFYMFATPSISAPDKKSWHGSLPPLPDDMDVLSPSYASLSSFEKMQRHHDCLTAHVQALKSSSDFNVHIVMPLMKGDLFYFIKLISDPSLAKVAVTPEYLGPVAAVYAFQVCFGLDYLHQCGIVHRDMKPDNVLVSVDHTNPYMSTALIADMGLARDTGDSETFYVCTRYYRPPDVVMGFSRGASATDVWSLGCIFYELCTCQTLFTMKSALNDRGTWDGYYASRQLEVILNIMGCPTQEDIERYAPKDTNAKSYLLRSVARAPQLESLLRNNWKLRVSEHEKQLWIDLIKSCLQFFPQQRPTAAQLCRHPLFRELNMFYGENVCQIPAQPYQPQYDEKHMNNQNRAENKHVSLGLVLKALAMTVPEEEHDDDDDDDDDDDVLNQIDAEAHNQLGAGDAHGSMFRAADSNENAAQKAPRGAAVDDDDDEGTMRVAPSIYAAGGFREKGASPPEDEERDASDSRRADGDRTRSQSDRRAVSGAVIENEESEKSDDVMTDSSSLSDSDRRGRQGGPYAYPSAFLRPAQDPPQAPPHVPQEEVPPSSGAQKMPRAAPTGTGDSFLDHYVVPSMFRHPDTNQRQNAPKEDDQEALEPATLLRRTLTGSGNVQAPYSYMNSMREPATDEQGTSRKRSPQPQNSQSDSGNAAAAGLERAASDLDYQYPVLNDVYGSGRGRTLNSSQHQTQPSQTAANGVPSFRLNTHASGSVNNDEAERSGRAASGGARLAGRSGSGFSAPSQPSQHHQSGDLKGLRGSDAYGQTVPRKQSGNGTTGWSIKGLQFEAAKVPLPPAVTNTPQPASHTEKPTTSSATAPATADSDGEGYSYFDGDVLSNGVNDYSNSNAGKSRSLVRSARGGEAAAATTAAPKSRPSSARGKGASQSFKYPISASASGVNMMGGYSFLQRHPGSGRTGKTSGGSDTDIDPPAQDDFPSLADKALEARYRQFTHSDGDMQKGMTAVLAELNQSTDDPEKAQQLREVMNYFGTQRHTRK